MNYSTLQSLEDSVTGEVAVIVDLDNEEAVLDFGNHTEVWDLQELEESTLE